MKCIGSFVNPVLKGHMPTDIIESYLNIVGTQFLITIPLRIGAESLLPNTTDKYLNMDN